MELLFDPELGAPSTFLMAHGAGAAMDSAGMNALVGPLVSRGIRVVRFEFDYMAARRLSPKRKPPPKAELLVQQYESAVETVRGRMTPSERSIVVMYDSCSDSAARPTLSPKRVISSMCHL